MLLARKARATAIVAVAAAAVVFGSTTVGAQPGHPSAAASTLTVALPPSTVPESVFPFDPESQCYGINVDYWNLMTRPGYWFGLGASTSVVPSLSTLTMPTFATTAADTTVTFATKGWTWSNGAGGLQAMTAQDVAFWLNMDRAQSNQGVEAACGYVAGYGIPDQVVSVAYPDGLSGDEVRIVFEGHPSHEWLLGNELSQIVPMAAAWDTTGSGFAGCATEPFASVKTDGTDPCSAVFSYLNGLEVDDPLWDWADGPYRQLSAPYHDGSPTGNDVQVANADYSGPIKAQAVQRIDYEPFTSSDSELGALESNQLDFGYLWPSAVSAAPGPGKGGRNLSAKLRNYAPTANVQYGVFYDAYNFDDANSTYSTTGVLPVWADLLNLQYFRAAMAQTQDQAYVVQHVYKGYAIPTYSAVPTYPTSSYGKGVVNPYPYSPAKAKAAMKAHGWDTAVVPDVCATSNCGTSQYPVPKGTKAVIEWRVASGSLSTEADNDESASIAKGAGIQLRIEYPDLVGAPCASPGWEICTVGGWIYQPDVYPSGEELLLPEHPVAAYANPGGYDDPEMNALIGATTTNGDLALNAIDPAYRTSYAQWSATDVPFLWQPVPVTVGEVAKSLRGEQSPSPFGNFNPEYITHI
jgi:peptide/nickel transport system substrate-binding protein